MGASCRTLGHRERGGKVGGEAGAWARGVLVIFYGTHYPMLCVHPPPPPPHMPQCRDVPSLHLCACVHVHKSVAGSGIYSRACSNSPSSL